MNNLISVLDSERGQGCVDFTIMFVFVLSSLFLVEKLLGCFFYKIRVGVGTRNWPKMVLYLKLEV